MLDMQSSHGCPKCKVECAIFQFYYFIFVCMHDMISLCIELQISLEFWWHTIAAWFCCSFANKSLFQVSRNWKWVINVSWCSNILGPKFDDKQNSFWSLKEFSSKISKDSFSLTESCKTVNCELVSRFWMVLVPRETGTVWQWNGTFFSLYLAQCIDVKARYNSR